jgi:hypothetical protein
MRLWSRLEMGRVADGVQPPGAIDKLEQLAFADAPQCKTGRYRWTTLPGASDRILGHGQEGVTVLRQ